MDISVNEGRISITSNAEEAAASFTSILPLIVSAYTSIQELTKRFPERHMAFRPFEGAESLGEILWYLNSAPAAVLNALCDGKFSELPTKPDPANPEAFLAWSQREFPIAFQRAANISGEDLLRPMQFAGIDKLSIDYLGLFVGNINSAIGQFLALWSVCEPEQVRNVSQPEGQSAPSSSNGELSDADLDTVSGGVVVTVTYSKINAIQPTYLSGLGSLFGQNPNPATWAVAGIPGFAMVGGLTAARILQGFAIAAFILRF